MIHRGYLQTDMGDNEEYGYEEVFIDTVPQQYECPICLLVCKQVVQTACGHRFCEKCIMKVIREGRPNCPVDNSELDQTKVHPDNLARKEIFCLNVRCHHYATHGCQWIGSLGSTNEHLETCEFGLVECTCGVPVMRISLMEHMENSCGKRVVSCEYCGSKFVFRMLEEKHLDQCPRMPVPCPNVCGNIPREELEEHLLKFCPRSILKCYFREFGCSFEGDRQAMKVHKETTQDVHFEKMADTIKSLKLACEHYGYELRNNKCESEREKLAGRITELEQSVDTIKENDVVYLRQNVIALTQKAEENENVVKELRSKMWNGCVIWKVNNFEEVFQQAEQGTTPAINSFSFYTGIPGYKMYIRINLNGVDAGKGTHISMFAHLIQGDYDSVIQWPFAGTIVFTIMDQTSNGEEKHVVERLTGKPSVQAFQKPNSSQNSNGYGYAKMISHVELRKHSYIRDDCMLIKVEVEKQV